MQSLLALLEVICIDTILYNANTWLKLRTQKQWLTDYERMGFFKLWVEHTSFRQLSSKCSRRER